MQSGVTSYMNLFANDTKLMRIVKNTDDCRELQGDIDKIKEWSRRWKLDFDAKKCQKKMGLPTLQDRRERED